MKPRRRSCAAALAVLALLGFYLSDPTQLRNSVAEAPIEAVAMPLEDAVTQTWYCPGGMPANSTTITATEDDAAVPGVVEDKVFIANTADAKASVLVQALSKGVAPIAKEFSIDARSSITVAVAELSQAPDAALIVRAFSGGIVVEQLVKIPQIEDIAIAPCATTSSSTWYFAAGSTARGSSEWLSLLNPYTADAVIDITIVLKNEVRKPSDLQALVVGARSRRSIFINDAADRQDVVGLIIKVAGGHGIVAQRTIVHPRRSEHRGVSSSLGAISESTRFTFSGGARSKLKHRVLYVLNPGLVATDVDIQVIGEGATPVTLTVDAQSVQKLNVEQLVPQGAGFALVVQAAADLGAATGKRSERGIVVEDVERFEGYRASEGSQPMFGVASAVGGVRPSEAWTFGLNSIDGATDASLFLYNPNEKAALVDVSLVIDGRVVEPDALQDITLAGASRLVMSLSAEIEAIGAMIVESSSPIYVERVLAGPNLVTRAAGIPLRD